MKLATTATLPKKTSAKVNDPDTPAWTQDMLGAPVLKHWPGPPGYTHEGAHVCSFACGYFGVLQARGSGYQSRINAALRMAGERNLTDHPGAATRKRVAI